MFKIAVPNILAPSARVRRERARAGDARRVPQPDVRALGSSMSVAPSCQRARVCGPPRVKANSKLLPKRGLVDNIAADPLARCNQLPCEEEKQHRTQSKADFCIKIAEFPSISTKPFRIEVIALKKAVSVGQLNCDHRTRAKIS